MVAADDGVTMAARIAMQSAGKGFTVDFLCRSSAEEIHRRSRAMLLRAGDRGGYALGSGNSVPDYVPDEAFLAMIQAALEERT